MAKLNLVLLAVLMACALGLVTSQHDARKLFSDLEREQQRARDLDIEYGQLQLEASTWGLHSRVEKIATAALAMHAPDPRRVRLVNPAADSAAKPAAVSAAKPSAVPAAKPSAVPAAKPSAVPAERK